MSSDLTIRIPDGRKIKPGDIIRIGRFDTILWKVYYGWYSWGGNRPVCGWYITDTDNPTRIKPLQLPDLDDIYLIKYSPCEIRKGDEIDSE